MKKIIKQLFVAILLLSPICLIAEEKIFLILDKDLSLINKYLDNGWTVKHQSVSTSVSSANSYDTSGKYSTIMLITLEKKEEKKDTKEVKK